MLLHASCGVWAAAADAYPNRPVRIVDGFAAGGSTDYVARIIGAKMTERSSQPVLVDNRPGAAGTVAAEYTARSAPDGYTLYIHLSTILMSSPSLYAKLGYDLMKDFSYVAVVATGMNVLVVHPSVPSRTVKELVAFARAKPKSVRYGSGGVGSSIHLTMEVFRSRTQLDLLHVPYKGGAPMVAALAGGEVEVAFASVTTAVPMIKANKLNALAVSGAKRLALMPDVPTVAEAGVPGFEVKDAFGIVGPAGVPAAIVKLLNADLRNIVQMEDVRTRLASQGLEPASMTPEEVRTFMTEEMARWARVIKDANIPPI